MKYNFITLVQKFRFLFSYITQKGFSELKFLKKIIEDDSNILDVGSNVGSFVDTIKKANKYVKVYSIEPDISLIKYQKKKFKKLNNIHYSNIGIDIKSGETKFYLRDPVSHSSLLKHHPDNKFNKIVSIFNVTVQTIEDFMKLQSIDQIKLIKIDTEGLDYDILLSIKNLIINKKIEFIKIEANKNSIEKIVNFAYSNNLKIVGISNLFYYQNRLNMVDLYLENKNL